MSIQKKIIAVFLLLLMLFIVVSETSSFIFSTEKSKEAWTKDNRINLNTILDLQKQSVSILALQLANDPSVIRAYEQNDPQIIIDAITPFWKRVKKKDLIYEIHFFKPPAISFVNFSNFNSIGADVKRVRKDIVWVTSAFKDSRHLMMCKTYAGVRATYPILDENGMVLGGLSLGKKVDWIPNALHKLTSKEAFLVYTEASAKSLAKKYYDDFVKDKTQIGKYIFAESTIAIPDEILASIDFTKPQQSMTVEGKEYSLDRIELLDFTGNVMGYVGVMNDMDPFYERLLQRIFRNIGIFIILGIILLFLFHRQIKKLLEYLGQMKSLTHQFKKGEFSDLDNYNIDALEAEKGSDEMKSLMLDILHMGETLRRYYTKLEDEVSSKTLALFNANKALEDQLYIDRLTGLPNRHSFFRDTAGWKAPQLALININGFKRLNDLYGVNMGNILLVELARFCSENLADKEVSFFRLGADEFAITANGVYKHVDFEIMVFSLLDEIQDHEFIIGAEKIAIHISFSAGISFEAEHTIETADMALHQAKTKRKKYVLYSEELGLDKDYEKSISLTKKLRTALTDDGIMTYYQPIVDRSGKRLKYEALVRMQDGEKVLTPFHFLEFSKESRYYKDITHIVIDQAFNEFADRKEAFSVNLTAEDILDQETMEIINLKLQNFPDKERVVFEIVESESIHNIEEVEQFINEVRDMGAKVAIDDFGSGYSNFSYLLKLAPDYLKIDGSLIKEINTDMNARTIVKTIIGFAKELRIKTIAEYVHSEAVFEVCKELGVDEFQGYYFSEPLSEI
ncbi:MAG: EAL domain-containing protein [Campylobacterota bacterium]|nr:EAL domain-containing protein [Campylobacterota bacterium]